MHWRCRSRTGRTRLISRSGEDGGTRSTKLYCEWLRDVSESTQFLFGRRSGYIWSTCWKLKICRLMFVCKSFTYCVVASIFITAEMAGKKKFIPAFIGNLNNLNTSVFVHPNYKSTFSNVHLEVSSLVENVDLIDKGFKTYTTDFCFCFWCNGGEWILFVLLTALKNDF